MCLRDKGRYGLFSADSNRGRVQVSISICGFGEKIEVYQNKKCIASMDTEDDYLDETDTKLCLNYIEIALPFRKCLKRYK